MTLIDKAEAHDDDMIRRGDALAIVEVGPVWVQAAIRALPARGVGVPADVRDYAIDVSEAFDTMMEVERNPAGAWQAIQALAGHLAALAPTDAAHVNETPKSEHDAGNVLTAAQAREVAMQELIDAYEDIIDYGPLVLAKKDQWERVRVAKEKLKEART